MKPQTTESTLVPNSIARHMCDIPAKRVIKGYKQYGIDIRKNFSDLRQISIYKCDKSGYSFYLPSSLAGDSKFYESLQDFKWYYLPWKWEHEIALSYLNDGQSVLEVGCAHGAFLKGLNSRFKMSRSIGLELNESTPSDAESFKIVNLEIEEFQKENLESFDVVCSFQVLEHVHEVHRFLQAKINCLKSGGKLLISVPNNDSFVGKNFSVLNMPPHHMGLWNKVSLKYLEQLFPIRLVDIHYEPLQEYHVESYVYSAFYSKYPRWIGNPLKILNKLTGRYKDILSETAAKRMEINGHTIFAAFSKI